MLNYSGGFELAHALPELVPTNIPVEGSRSPGYTVVGHITTDKVTSGTRKAAYPHQRFTPVFFRMFRRGDFTGEVRRKLRAELSSLGEGVRACAEEITRNGLPARAIAPLLRVARGPSPSLPQLKPLVSYNAAFRAKPDRHCEPLQLCTHHGDSPEHSAHTQKRQEFSHSAQAYITA